MEFGSKSCREEAVAMYFGDTKLSLYLSSNEEANFKRIKDFINNLERYLGFNLTKFSKKENSTYRTLTIPEQWNRNSILFSIYLTALRASFKNKTSNPLKLEKNDKKVSIYSYHTTLSNTALKNLSKSINILKLIRKFGVENVFKETKFQHGTSEWMRLCQYGISRFCSNFNGNRNKKVVNEFLKPKFQLK